MKKIILSIITILFLSAMPSIAAEKEKNNKEPAIPLTSGNKATGIELPTDQTVNFDEGFISIPAICKGQVKWLVVSSIKVKYISNDNNNSIIISIPPQQATISVFAVGLVDGKITEFVRTNITVNGQPLPQPDPVKPVPAPGKGPYHMTLIIDVNQMSTETAQMLNSETFRKNLSDKKTHLHIFDSKNHAQLIKDKKLDRAIPNNSTTAIIIQDKDGKVILSQELPKTENDILNILQKITG